MPLDECPDDTDGDVEPPDDRVAAAFHGRRVLVTGGLGFLGSNLSIQLVRCGARVTLLDSLISEMGGCFGNIASIRNQVVVNRSDMRDASSLEILVRDQDYIFNLAGQVSHGDSMRYPQLDLGVNCVSTMNLVEACRKHNPDVQMLYTSTRQVYPTPVHRMAAYQFLGYGPGALPITERVAQRVLSLPCYPELPIDAAPAICSAINDVTERFIETI
jgi:nucleoside-diphosphate-sugar epimerase